MGAGVYLVGLQLGVNAPEFPEPVTTKLYDMGQFDLAITARSCGNVTINVKASSGEALKPLAR